MKKAVLFFSVIIITCLTSAQILKPVKWSFSASKAKPAVGETIDIVFDGKIDKGWHLYSSELKVEGPMPTEVEFEPNASYQLVGKLKAINPKEKYDEVWEGKITYFDKQAKFIQKIKILKAGAIIEGKIKCQTCTDKDGKCVPNKDKFSLNL
jgi:DsbC/DsbD-like thiol-disulfide interchange protein